MSARKKSISVRIAELARAIKADTGVAVTKIDIAWASWGDERSESHVWRREDTAEQREQRQRDYRDEKRRHLFNGRADQEITGIHFEADGTDWTMEGPQS